MQFNVTAIVILLSIYCGVVAASLESDVEQLLKQVKDIKDKEQGYLSTIVAMQDKLNGQDLRIKKLELNDKQKDGIISDLQQQISLQNSRQDEAKSDLSEHLSLATVNIGLDDIRMSNKLKENQSLSTEKQLKSVKDVQRKRPKIQKSRAQALNRREIVAQNTHQVAFHAVADADQLHLGKGQNIAFETVLLNVGNGYHNQHGVFIAPVGGIYVFSVTIMNLEVSDHEFLQIALFRDGSRLGCAMADGRFQGFHQSSFVATTQLEDGDEVWVETTWPENEICFHGDRYSSFTGFLLASI